MGFSNGERLILAMLCDISKKLGARHEIDPALVIKSLGTYEWGLAWEYSGLVDGDNPPAVEETANILTMWRMLEQVYANLPEAEQQRVREAIDRGDDPVKFPGFDGNHDEHYGIAQYMIRDLGRFEHFKDHYLNSHTQSTLPRHRRMLERFDAMALHDDPSADRIIGIMKD